MGFDVLYFPPIHPIGKTNRKGKNNATKINPDDVGSPWAIGSNDGGHKAIHPQLGTLEDFERLIARAKEVGMEIAMDLAFQCSPDHPYMKEHPEWFRWRPDGTIQFAENPPKKYEDIIPLNFETEKWQELWEELKSVVFFWIERGIRIFRVDNPHTKPFSFWEWLIGEIKREYPDAIFLSEAFTRPKVMVRLAKLGFTQSYTYFTWRNTKRELVEYLTELTQTEAKEYFRPNFWPNTPDILPEHLQYGGRPAFIIRLILAATLSSNYGIYGPAFELLENEAIPGKEEYLNAEKYEIKHWNWNQPGNLRDFVARVNQIRKENPVLQTTWNLHFYEVDNDYFLFYAKFSEDFSNLILVLVNLDCFHTQSGWVRVPIHELGIDARQPYLVHDLLSDDKFIWQGERNYVELNPQVLPANILRVRKRLKRETDFDYFL
jgi:starch synthase (maltosyl-transferring)